jgi:hypothetical protein
VKRYKRFSLVCGGLVCDDCAKAYSAFTAPIRINLASASRPSDKGRVGYDWRTRQ